MAEYYFAYGSNMNPARVQRRQMQYTQVLGASLADYQLHFNKRSVKYPGAASANVMAQAGAVVEGLAYRLAHPGQIEMMDPFEGFPVRYRREALEVTTSEGPVRAWVYIANPDFIAEGLLPARWYLNHLLKGKPHLSADYHQRLAGVACLPDSDIEPE